MSKVIKVKNTKIGGDNFAIIAGPCSIESKEQYFEIGRIVKSLGANIIRGSVFKPRTSPNSFQGLGFDGLKYIKELGDELNIPTVSEVMDTRQVAKMSKSVDILQVGARNMYNYDLLKELAKYDNPVMLKRGISATVDEWLGASEYLIKGGNENVILCERGVRTFSTYTRNTLDLSIISYIKDRTDLPIIIDPSHATGKRGYIIPASKASVAAGADGIMVEVHNNPIEALSDGPQSLLPKMFMELIEAVQYLLTYENKVITGSSLRLCDLRLEVDNIDSNIIKLIASRFNVIEKITKTKKNDNLKAYQPIRERHLQRLHYNVSKKFNIDSNLVEGIFESIITKSKQLQDEKKCSICIKEIYSFQKSSLIGGFLVHNSCWKKRMNEIDSKDTLEIQVKKEKEFFINNEDLEDLKNVGHPHKEMPKYIMSTEYGDGKI